MKRALADGTWDDIEAFRRRLAELSSAAAVETVARGFTALFPATYANVLLARLFLVLRFDQLPEAERAQARALVRDDARLGPATRVLTLLGTAGRAPGWDERTRSAGHRAIPLLDRSFVEGAPMIAKLLADLQVDLSRLDSGLPLVTELMMGGTNRTFYVPDAQVALDERGRHVIADQGFAKQYGVRTVFGMGGAYLDGTLAVAIIFSSEQLDRMVVDRFPSLISTFRTATARMQSAGAFFEPS